jgi:hypothetical protein
MELAEFEVVADSLWNSAEGRFYKKGDTIKLPSNTQVKGGGSIKYANTDDEEPSKRKPGRPAKSVE